MEEYKIGEIFEVDGEKCQCVKDDVEGYYYVCNICTFENKDCFGVLCNSISRKDGIGVHFEKLQTDK